MLGCQVPVAAAVGLVQAGGRPVVASGSVAAAGGLFVAVCGGVACFCGSVPGPLRRCRLPRLARASPVRRGRVRLRRQSRRSAITSCWSASRSRLSATVSRWVACWFRRSAAWSRWSGRPRVAARGVPVRSRPARCPVTFGSRLRRRSGRSLFGRDGTGTAGIPRSRAGLGTAAGTCPGSCVEQVALPVAATSARSGRVSSGGTSASIWCRRPSPMMRS